MVDLNEAIKAAKGEIVTIDMESATQTASNVSSEVKSMKTKEASNH